MLGKGSSSSSSESKAFRAFNAAKETLLYSCGCSGDRSMAFCSGLVGAARADVIAGCEGSTMKVLAGCAEKTGPVLSCRRTPSCIP